MKWISSSIKILVLCVAGFGSLAAQESDRQSEDRSVRTPDAVEKIHDGFAFTEGPADDHKGGFFFSDIPNNKIHHVDANGQLTEWSNNSRHSNGLVVDGRGRLIACEMDGAVAAYDVESKQRTVLADNYEGQRFNAPNDLVVDSEGGIYFTDPRYRAPQPLPQGVEAVYYIARDGDVRRLTGNMPAPNGIALSPDGKQLYIASSEDSQMLVAEVQSPGQIGEPKPFYKVTQPSSGKTGSDGIAVDADGNIYFTTALGIEVVDPTGKQREIIAVPQQPANVTFAGPDRQHLIITARTGVYRKPMKVAGVQLN